MKCKSNRALRISIFVVFLGIAVGCDIDAYRAQSELEDSGLDPSSIDAFHRRVEVGDKQTTHLFLEAQEIKVSAKRPSDGRAALHLAAMQGDAEIIELLVQAGADIEATDKESYTPLALASKAGNSSAVRTLIELGANVHAQTQLGRTPLWLAAKGGRATIVSDLLVGGAQPNAKDVDGNSPLHTAVQSGSLMTVKTLLNHGADPQRSNIDNRTPVDLAAQSDDSDILRLSKEYGGTVTCKRCDELLAAIEEGDSTAVKQMLSDGVSPDAQTGRGPTALIRAVTLKNRTIVAALIEAGVDPNDTDTEGNSAVHAAVAAADQTVLQWLLALDRTRIDIANSHGLTPLMHAMALGRHDEAELLFKHGAGFPHEEKVHQTPLHVAAKHGAPILAKLVDLADTVDPRTQHGVTPLMLAAASGNEQATVMLLNAGADLESQDEEQATAFIYAARNGKTATIRRLISAGANPNAKTLDGWRAIHYAALSGNPSVVRQLVEAGVDPNTPTIDGRTPTWLATDAGHDATASLLQSLGGTLQ